VLISLLTKNLSNSQSRPSLNPISQSHQWKLWIISSMLRDLNPLMRSITLKVGILESHHELQGCQMILNHLMLPLLSYRRWPIRQVSITPLITWCLLSILIIVPQGGMKPKGSYRLIRINHLALIWWNKQVRKS
jgi:hypothetical protein